MRSTSISVVDMIMKGSVAIEVEGTCERGSAAVVEQQSTGVKEARVRTAD
jgi:hypothetical protein